MSSILFGKRILQFFLLLFVLFARKVFPEAHSLVECPMARVTFKRFVIRMNDFVLFKVIWPLKTFTADLQQKKTEERLKKIREKVPISSNDHGITSIESSQLTYLLTKFVTIFSYFFNYSQCHSRSLLFSYRYYCRSW